jgi:hypothetical protein
LSREIHVSCVTSIIDSSGFGSVFRMEEGYFVLVRIENLLYK